MADDNKTKLNIRLHVYDEEMSVTIQTTKCFEEKV